jgi:hypothetical protein
MLMSNASSPWEGSQNRDSYLSAAGNLLDDLDKHYRCQFLDAAVKFAAHAPISNVDAINASMRSPLGAMRVNDSSDARPAAAFLAGRLANSKKEKRAVRDAALRLIGAGADEDFRVTKTLQLVQSESGDSVGLLAHGGWTLRSLAAILWSESPELSMELGRTLSHDRDVRVRRALAGALTRVDERCSEVRDALLKDTCWSVRSRVRTSVD